MRDHTPLTRCVRPAVTTWLQPVAVIALCLVLAGCGSDSPSAPTPTYPNVAGTWTGDYQLTACNDAGARSFCDGYPPVGSIGPITLALTQNSGQLSGTLTLGQFVVPVSGTVTTSGRIALGGKSQTLSANVQGVSFSVQLTVSNWDTQAAGASMTGSWRQTFDVTGDIVGQAFTDQTIRTLTRS